MSSTFYFENRNKNFHCKFFSILTAPVITIATFIEFLKTTYSILSLLLLLENLFLFVNCFFLIVQMWMKTIFRRNRQFNIAEMNQFHSLFAISIGNNICQIYGIGWKAITTWNMSGLLPSLKREQIPQCLVIAKQLQPLNTSVYHWKCLFND